MIPRDGGIGMSDKLDMDPTGFWAVLERLGQIFQDLEDENTMLRADIVKMRIERGDYRGDYDEPPNPATVLIEEPSGEDLAELP